MCTLDSTHKEIRPRCCLSRIYNYIKDIRNIQSLDEGGVHVIEHRGVLLGSLWYSERHFSMHGSLLDSVEEKSYFHHR